MKCNFISQASRASEPTRTPWNAVTNLLIPMLTSFRGRCTDVIEKEELHPATFFSGLHSPETKRIEVLKLHIQTLRWVLLHVDSLDVALIESRELRLRRHFDFADVNLLCQSGLSPLSKELPCRCTITFLKKLLNILGHTCTLHRRASLGSE